MLKICTIFNFQTILGAEERLKKIFFKSDLLSFQSGNIYLSSNENKNTVSVKTLSLIKQYLENDFQIPSSAYELSLVRSSVDDNVQHYMMNMMVHGLPVDNLQISIHMVDGYIIHINGTVLYKMHELEYPNEFLISDDESDDDLREVINDYFAINSFHSFHSQKVYYYHDDHMYLAYKVQFSNYQMVSPHVWVVWVDAETGYVLNKEPLTFHLTGEGQVYKKNKVLTPKPEMVDLIELDEEGGKLSGKYVRVYNADPDEEGASEEENSFIYDEDDSRFAEVSAYYHGTSYLKWMEELGAEYEVVLTVYVHAYRGDSSVGWNNAQYHFEKGENPYTQFDPLGDFIEIGDGDGKVLQNLGTDGDVLMHEIGHFILYRYGGLESLDGESGVLHEGVSDYFLYHFTDDPCLGESAVATKNFGIFWEDWHCIRGAADGVIKDENGQPVFARYKEWIPPKDNQGYVDKQVYGHLISATLWQVRQSLKKEEDKETYTQVVLKSLLFIYNKSGDFEDFANALLLSDKTHAEGKFKCDIANALYQRNLTYTSEEVSTSDCTLIPYVPPGTEEEDDDDDDDSCWWGCSINPNAYNNNFKHLSTFIWLVLLTIGLLVVKRNFFMRRNLSGDQDESA